MSKKSTNCCFVAAQDDQLLRPTREHGSSKGTHHHFGPASVDAAWCRQNSVEGLPHAQIVAISEPVLGAGYGPPGADVMDLDMRARKVERIARQGPRPTQRISPAGVE